MTAEKLKGYIEQILSVLTPVAAFTTTTLDDIAVEALKSLGANDALLALVVNLFVDGDVDVPAELQAEWETIQPALTPLRKVVEIL